MPQELWVISVGWVVVIAMPVLIASVIWASTAKRQRGTQWFRQDCPAVVRSRQKAFILLTVQVQEITK